MKRDGHGVRLLWVLILGRKFRSWPAEKEGLVEMELAREYGSSALRVSPRQGNNDVLVCMKSSCPPCSPIWGLAERLTKSRGSYWLPAIGHAVTSGVPLSSSKCASSLLLGRPALCHDMSWLLAEKVERDLLKGPAGIGPWLCQSPLVIGTLSKLDMMR